MPNVHILITGAAGVLGKSLTSFLIKAGYRVTAVDIVQKEGIIYADLRCEAATFQLIKNHTPNLIIHLASNKNIIFCEENKKSARAINYGITEIITRACLQFNIRLIYFSSDYVFGQKDCFWKESDILCPTTQYGKDKADSERLIEGRLYDYAIIRTAQLYGVSKDFVSLVYNTLSSYRRFRAYSNLVNCPTWSGDLFAMLHKIIQHNLLGVFHCVGPEALSRYQFACMIAKEFNLNSSYIKPQEIDFSRDIRPPVVRLSGISTYKTLGVYPGTLRENISMYLCTTAGSHRDV